MLEDIKREVQSTIAPLLSGILNDIQLLFRQEVALAKTEVRQEVTKIKVASLFLVISMVCGIGGLLFLGFALVHLLAQQFSDMPLWGSYGIVALIAFALSVCFYFKCMGLGKTIRLMPEKTFESIKEDAQWIKERI